MSTYLTAQSLTLNYTSTPLFDDLTFTLKRGDKVGLIGHNGCGKSSLIKLLAGQNEPSSGHIAKANHCLMSYVEQHIPESLRARSILDTLVSSYSNSANIDTESWRAELLLTELGFAEVDFQMPVSNCSGGQQMRLLLARAIINEPDLLLLDEPSNHLDLQSLIWLENFLKSWKGSFILVSHDQTLLDAVTNTTWIMRDQSLYHYALPCTQAREALEQKDEQDRHRYAHEQKEIDRIDKSAKRLAMWGQTYDNEDFARKAKSMQGRKKSLEQHQTQLSEGTPWRLQLQGEPLKANRLLEILPFTVRPPQNNLALFDMSEMRIKSGDRVAVLGSNGCGKSTLLNLLHQVYLHQCLTTDSSIDYSKKGLEIVSNEASKVTFHERCRLGYYDQSQNQLDNTKTLIDTLIDFSRISHEHSKIALISAGFEYASHEQTVTSLSGGERARLLFVGLTLAKYHLLFLDEPTNHLDMEGKEELIGTLNEFEGATLIVSHDRFLIEKACNRFWFVESGKLTEYLSTDDVYQRISDRSDGTLDTDSTEYSYDLHSIDCRNANQPDYISNDTLASDEDKLLARLVELETLLEADLQQKFKKQKPKLQEQWRLEISNIEAQIL